MYTRLYLRKNKCMNPRTFEPICRKFAHISHEIHTQITCCANAIYILPKTKPPDQIQQNIQSKIEDIVQEAPK